MPLTDLSQDIYEGMKVYPGHLKTVQFEHATHEETAPRFDGGFSFQTTGFLLNDNGPTHVDSFSHLDPDPSAETIEKMALDLFYGPAICLDVTGFAPQTDITAEDLDTALAKSGQELRAGDIVLFHTATWNRYAGDRRYLTDFPRPRRRSQRVDRAAPGQDVRRGQPDPGQPRQHQLSLPHDVPSRAHHPLREPRQPRQGRQHPLRLHRLPAQAAGRSRWTDACRRPRRGLAPADPR
jgi:hypothetical protein